MLHSTQLQARATASEVTPATYRLHLIHAHLHMAVAAGVGATVLQLGGGPKQLYYYPQDTTLVVNVGPAVNKGEASITAFHEVAEAAAKPVQVQQPLWCLIASLPSTVALPVAPAH